MLELGRIQCTGQGLGQEQEYKCKAKAKRRLGWHMTNHGPALHITVLVQEREYWARLQQNRGIVQDSASTRITEGQVLLDTSGGQYKASICNMSPQLDRLSAIDWPGLLENKLEGRDDQWYSIQRFVPNCLSMCWMDSHQDVQCANTLAALDHIRMNNRGLDEPAGCSIGLSYDSTKTWLC